MRGGRQPIHLQKWAPADFQADEVVKLLLLRRDYRALVFYRQFLDHSFMAGGDLPASPEALSACLSMPQLEVERALASIAAAEGIIGQKLLELRDGRLGQKRVRAEVEEELHFRAQQAEHGRKRWVKGGQRLAYGNGSGEPEASQEGSLSPPPPTPTPTPKEPPIAPLAGGPRRRRGHGAIVPDDRPAGPPINWPRVLIRLAAGIPEELPRREELREKLLEMAENGKPPDLPEFQELTVEYDWKPPDGWSTAGSGEGA